MRPPTNISGVNAKSARTPTTVALKSPADRWTSLYDSEGRRVNRSRTAIRARCNRTEVMVPS